MNQMISCKTNNKVLKYASHVLVHMLVVIGLYASQALAMLLL